MRIDCHVASYQELPEEHREQARRFIVPTWRTSFMNYRGNGTDARVYKQGQTRLINRLLERCDVRIVLPNPDATDLFWGYVVREGNVAHYVYVKDVYRQHGIATELMQGVRIVTHRPTLHVVKRWADRMGWVYDPYRLYKETEDETGTSELSAGGALSAEQ